MTGLTLRFILTQNNVFSELSLFSARPLLLPFMDGDMYNQPDLRLLLYISALINTLFYYIVLNNLFPELNPDISKSIC